MILTSHRVEETTVIGYLSQEDFRQWGELHYSYELAQAVPRFWSCCG